MVRVRKRPATGAGEPHSECLPMLDPEVCYRAVLARDPRFDGRFFTCVTSTGIYCRPICPARTPRRENCRFAPSAAAAQELGFRPCLRCRPELSPHLAAFRGTEATRRARALADRRRRARRRRRGVDALAERLGLGERQLPPSLRAAPRCLAGERRADAARAVRAAAHRAKPGSRWRRSRWRPASAASAASTRCFARSTKGRRRRCGATSRRPDLDRHARARVSPAVRLGRRARVLRGAGDTGRRGRGESTATRAPSRSTAPSAAIEVRARAAERCSPACASRR